MFSCLIAIMIIVGSARNLKKNVKGLLA